MNSHEEALRQVVDAAYTTARREVYSRARWWDELLTTRQRSAIEELHVAERELTAFRRRHAPAG